MSFIFDGKKIDKVHFIGIASPFASFCAEKLINLGVKVTASEINQDSKNAKYWLVKGVLYEGGHNSKYIHKSIDLVVYPNGPIPGNVECEETERQNIPFTTLAKLTGELSKNHKTIAIAGTHGKTTTTALVIWLLTKLHKMPNFIISDADDVIFGINKNYNINNESEFLVLEACEYKKQFLDRAPKPFASIITNIDLDHTDFFKSQEEYNKAFTEFLNHTDSIVIINKSGKNEADALPKHSGRYVVYDYMEVFNIAKKVSNPHLKGIHNLQNMSCAISLMKYLGYSDDLIVDAMNKFKGVSRRFEYVCKTQNGNLVYRDYAHNPSKIEAAIATVKEAYPNRKIVLVFQPHSIERSFSFQKEFAQSVKNAEIVLIPNIFSPFREKTLYSDLITPEKFVDILKEQNPNKQIEYTDGYANISKIIRDLDKKNGQLFLFASAGDMQNKVKEIVKGISKIILLGIGGEAVYYSALYFKYLGYEVEGYDSKQNERTEKLEKLGIKINYKNPEKAFPDSVNEVIYSSGIPKNIIQLIVEMNPKVKFIEVGRFYRELVKKREGKKLSVKQLNAMEKSGITPLYDVDLRGLKLIGITGTDGKTTTSEMLYTILKNAGKKVALISTISAKINDEKFDTGFHTTTPSSHALKTFIEKAIEKDCEYMIIESTSQGLYMGRLAGLKFDVVGYTNITREHLEYHKNFRNYINAKALLIKNHLKENGKVVLNKDDKIQIKHLSPLVDSLAYYSYGEKNSFGAKFPFVETYNIKNALCALTICKSLGISDEFLKHGLDNFQSPTGRMQILQTDPFYVIVDFAHTPNALENALTEVRKLKKYPNNKLICVFGCASQRDDSKRPKMGYIAGKNSDVVILTAEDPRYESLKQINDQIEKGFRKAKTNCELIRFDDDTQNIKVRRDAIFKALKIACENDVVIICGKGHEKSLCFGSQEYNWNDIEETRKLLINIAVTLHKQ